MGDLVFRGLEASLQAKEADGTEGLAVLAIALYGGFKLWELATITYAEFRKELKRRPLLYKAVPYINGADLDRDGPMFYIPDRDTVNWECWIARMRRHIKRQAGVLPGVVRAAAIRELGYQGYAAKDVANMLGMCDTAVRVVFRNPVRR